jgi:hypothetical protein
MAPGWLHKLDSELLGYNNLVNILIDWPVRLLGPRHRIYFHTLTEVIIIGFIVDGWDGVRGGISHLILDDMLSPEDCQMIMNVFYQYNLLQHATQTNTTAESKHENKEKPLVAEAVKVTPIPEPKRGEVINITAAASTVEENQPTIIHAKSVIRGEVISVKSIPSTQEPPPIQEALTQFILKSIFS